MYCLLEMIAMAEEELVPQFVQHLDWIKVCKADIRPYLMQNVQQCSAALKIDQAFNLDAMFEFIIG